MPTPSLTDRKPRVLVVVGTRPEAIKMAPVLKGLEERADEVESVLALTGQHDELVDQVLDAFGLSPAFDLEVMKEGQDLYDLAHSCLDGMREVLAASSPDLILVQGDTATVFYASLAAFFEGTQVGHVEAGLRSGRKRSPFPEELFRRLTGALTDLHFAPTERARQNLLREGVDPASIYLTGNTVVDALLATAEKERAPANPDLARVLSEGGRLVLLTAHRRESFGEPMREIFSAVRELVSETPELEVLYPVHPNPQVRVPAEEILGGHPRISLTSPLDYFDLVLALKHSVLVLTDSGGIQEEAPTFGVPVLVLRPVTERPEGVEAGVAHLVGTNRERIMEKARELLGRRSRAEVPGAHPNPYGDGRAGERIADVVAARLTGSPRRTTEWRAE